MDRYKRSILKKSKIYRPYTLDGIGNFYFFAGHDQDQLRIFCQFFWRRLQLRRQRCHRFLRTFGVISSPNPYKNGSYDRRTRASSATTLRGM